MKRKSKVYIALLHYPMRNRHGDVITTSITNLDLHDIARAARTYEVDGLFILHPSPGQHQLIGQILHYWQEGYGGQYNPDRQEAFSRLYLLDSLRQAIEQIKSEHPLPLCTVATDAIPQANSLGYRELRQSITQDEQCVLLLFGTGWGMTSEFLTTCDRILEPIAAGADYNHLSVRSAVSIILDRLLGEEWW